MPIKFALSGGASFTVRDQTIHGDSENTSISNSYNTTTTKVGRSHNSSMTTDNGTYYNNYYDENYSSKSHLGGSTNSGNVYAEGYNYSNHNNTPAGNRNNNYRQCDWNSSYGLPLGPKSPRTPPPAPMVSRNQLSTTPAIPSPFHNSQPLRTAAQEQTFQPFAMSPTWMSFPNHTEPPSQNLSPQQTGLGLEIRLENRSPNPFIARIQSRTNSVQPMYGDVLYSSPIGVSSISSPRPQQAASLEAYRNFGFHTPKTEVGMLSPLHLPRA